MRDDSTLDRTGSHAGVALVDRAKDAGDWKAVVDWIAEHPEHAEGVARFLGGDKRLTAALSPPAVRSGSSIGGIELKEILGSGAMGVVHRGYDPILRRDVAVKVVRTEHALSPLELARFELERELVASLAHPNIVPVLSSGSENGVPYMVMPLMTGGSLAARLKALGPDRCLGAKESAGLVREIALGVQHANDRGLIHRDLKPANILLDANRKPLIADFGIAHRIDATMTATAGFAGTVPYMAPEQARAEKGLTKAVDIHALGAILFELLTGRTPFAGGDVAAILQRVIEEPAPLVRTLRADVPRDLETICARCLSKLPEDRYSSAGALAVQLAKYLNGEAIDETKRSWGSELARALSWRRETVSMGTWWSLFWGAASTFAALAVIQVALLAGAPPWASAAGLVYYLAAWAIIARWVQWAGRASMNPVERISTAMQYGMMLGCAAVVPWHTIFGGGEVAMVFRPFAAINGMAVFATGAFYWGRLYISGLLLMAVAACMPLIPIPYWPSAYGVALTLFQIRMAFHLRGVHRDAAVGRPTS